MKPPHDVECYFGGGETAGDGPDHHPEGTDEKDETTAVEVGEATEEEEEAALLGVMRIRWVDVRFR